MSVAPVARERRHTLGFLGYARSFAPVFLDTEVDMTAVRDHRDRRGGDTRYSWTTYLLHAAARVLAEHPEANSAIRGGIRPKVARYDAVHVKLALDKRLAGHRVVLSAVLPDVHTAGLDEIQRSLAHYRDGDPETMPEFARTRALHRLPRPLGALAFKAVSRSLRARGRTMGTLAVSSLGHAAVDGFHSVGGTTITLGVGRVVERPVVRDGRVGVAPVLRLNLAFDHRVIDGAEAADVLTAIRDRLERFTAADGEPEVTG
ncbi:2-oxo acid dehydrogenase subunit E2 [Actinokineospora inagensis]|uniref:2-oxo acid dehydrogenase subunit E2 n=1 Tax=Actinokineospora inagensis TaxID=103730 RepID=UPI000411F887|nr:2-oxo acid dehydrogenase subunit E2 [Actinokineospora inagensis]